MRSAPHAVDLPDDPAATEALGRQIGQRLGPGDVVALTGELGAGKTTFVRGLARGLGVAEPDAVASPTYLLVVEHHGPVPFVHADAYLPAKLRGFLEDGGLEYLFDAEKAVAVEWADRIRNLLPEKLLWVELQRGPRPGRRVVLRAARAGDYPWLREIPSMDPSG